MGRSCLTIPTCTKSIVIVCVCKRVFARVFDYVLVALCLYENYAGIHSASDK